MPQQFFTTVQFRERLAYTHLKVAAVLKGVPIGKLLDQMVDRELKQFTKKEASKALKDHPQRERLMAAW